MNKIYRYDSLESTNETAKEMILAGAGHGTVVIANNQTAGKGRYSRTFFSPPGHGIYMSVILHSAQLQFDNYLAISEQNAPREYRHKAVGLVEADGEKVFALDTIVGGIKSQYCGHIDLKSRGSENVWLDMIKPCIVGRLGLEFSMCAGFAAMILNFLLDDGQSECIFANIGGALGSSVGKTIALSDTIKL